MDIIGRRWFRVVATLFLITAMSVFGALGVGIILGCLLGKMSMWLMLAGALLILGCISMGGVGLQAIWDD